MLPEEALALIIASYKRHVKEEYLKAHPEDKTDRVEPDTHVPLVVLAGATREGLEVTAVRIAKPQRPEDELHCPFGNVDVVSSVCRSHPTRRASWRRQ